LLLPLSQPQRKPASPRTSLISAVVGGAAAAAAASPADAEAGAGERNPRQRFECGWGSSSSSSLSWSTGDKARGREWRGGREGASFAGGEVVLGDGGGRLIFEGRWKDVKKRRLWTRRSWTCARVGW